MAGKSYEGAGARVHEGIGGWLAARRLKTGQIRLAHRCHGHTGISATLTRSCACRQDGGTRRLRRIVGSRSIKNIETLIDESGNISIGRVGSFRCVAAAANDHTCIAMLVRQDCETLRALLKCLDKAIHLARSDNVFTDEVNER